MRKAYLYILESIRSRKKYVGVTHCLEERIDRHNSQRVISTKKDVPYKLVYSEIFDDLATARKRERFLKTTQGHRVIENKLLK